MKVSPLAVPSLIPALLLLLAATAARAALPADLDGDGCVGQPDLGILLASYLFDGGGDVDGDGDTDQADLGELLSYFGLCDQLRAELAGVSLVQYPYFDFTVAFNAGETVRIGVDPGLHPNLAGKTARVYVVAHKTIAQWTADPNLIDVSSGGAELLAFSNTTIQDNTFVVDSGTLSAAAGTGLGVGYDVVIDVNQNGKLDAGDVIDGYDDAQAGFYVVHDLVAPGPLPTSSTSYGTASTAGQQITYYPSGISGMGKLPLVVISHGNGHNYQWYQFLQSHLASYGYIVMSHWNNTSPGVETASTTTLQGTEYILANQGTIGGGVLNGHIDADRIVWIGHSRGGEGVVRAYDRVFDGVYSPAGFTLDDVRIVSSIAPTTLLGLVADPHNVIYHFLYGSADGDVMGGPPAGSRPFAIVDRAQGPKQTTYIHGADHNDFNCCGVDDFIGPAGTAIGRPEAQRIQKAEYLALIKHYLDGSVPARDYFFRQYEVFKPIGTHYTSPETGAPVELVKQYRLATASPDKKVIDDYQTQTSSATASSGASVVFNVTNVFENVLRDTNSDFTWTTADPMNAMTCALSGDVSRGVVFDWIDPGTQNFYEFQLLPADQDLSSYDVLSFRACQGSRHPNTIAALGDLTFAVALLDLNGKQSLVNIGAFGGGVEEPYQRTGAGTGVGWANEFETIRIPLVSYRINGSGIDLSKIARITLWFGTAHGATVGRLGFDDVEVARN